LKYAYNKEEEYEHVLQYFNSGMKITRISSVQLLTGIKYATKSFGDNKNNKFYVSFRIGLGWYNYDHYYSFYSVDNDSGITWATEWDIMYQFGRLYVGPSFNKIYNKSSFGIKAGIEFGEKKKY